MSDNLRCGGRVGASFSAAYVSIGLDFFPGSFTFFVEYLCIGVRRCRAQIVAARNVVCLPAHCFRIILARFVAEPLWNQTSSSSNEISPSPSVSMDSIASSSSCCDSVEPMLCASTCSSSRSSVPGDGVMNRLDPQRRGRRGWRTLNLRGRARGGQLRAASHTPPPSTSISSNTRLSCPGSIAIMLASHKKSPLQPLL